MNVDDDRWKNKIFALVTWSGRLKCAATVHWFRYSVCVIDDDGEHYKKVWACTYTSMFIKMQKGIVDDLHL